MEDKDKKQKKPNFIWKSILKDGKGVKKEDVIKGYSLKNFFRLYFRRITKSVLHFRKLSRAVFIARHKRIFRSYRLRAFESCVFRNLRNKDRREREPRTVGTFRHIRKNG